MKTCRTYLSLPLVAAIAISVGACSAPSDDGESAAVDENVGESTAQQLTSATISVKSVSGGPSVTFTGLPNCPASWATVVPYGTPDSTYGPYVDLDGRQQAGLGGISWNIEGSNVMASHTNQTGVTPDGLIAYANTYSDGQYATAPLSSIFLPGSTDAANQPLVSGRRYEVRLFTCWYHSLGTRPATALQVKSRASFVAR